jgi:DNA mismatch repair ATPase MutL
MGFRGEALASMTYVGHVTVTTITEGQLHGYRLVHEMNSSKSYDSAVFYICC